MKKIVLPVCKNCLLYDLKNKHCQVIILHEGEKIYPPTDPEDFCIFEQEFVAINEDGKLDRWKNRVEEVKIWCENEKGEKSDKGQIKIQFPESYFQNTTNV